MRTLALLLLLPALALGQAVAPPPTVTGTNSGTNTGDVTLGAVGSSPSANAASLSGQALTLQPADATHPGVVSSAAQTFGGLKNFQDGLVVSSVLSAKRTSQWITLTPSATSFTGIGIGVPASTTGTASAAPTADGTQMMVQYLSGSSTSNLAGIIGDGNLATRFDFRPRITFVVRTDGSDVTNQRIWVGIGDGDRSGDTSLSALNSHRLAYFRYDTSLSDTSWMAITSDGTTASATSTGIAVTAATTYTLQADLFTAGTCVFRINGTAVVTTSTHVPSGATNVGPAASLTTLTNAAHSLYVAKMVLEQN